MRADPGHGGLYEPSTERAACGIGFIADLNGVRSHQIVRDVLRIGMNLEHRGASGADPETGDGLGILVQMPHEFLQNVACDARVKLPDRGEYGAGNVFLPKDSGQRSRLEELLETVVDEEGQQMLGWRTVPQVSGAAGRLASENEPRIRQVFIGRGAGLTDADAFERKLYVIRKRVERMVREQDLDPCRQFYIPSLSRRTLVYKGLLLADRFDTYFPDLTDPTFVSAMALVHQRYSTNTLPTWDLAQPFRFLCHNGEINTLRGNINRMHARERLFESQLFGDDMAKILPIVTPGASDSAVLDNTVELLYHTGRSLPHCIAMLIPEAWENHRTMSPTKRAFYEFHSCMMEPWDGPASIAFTDGKMIGATLDRNGLRPSRYLVTKDGRVVMASETGVLDIAPENIESKGRLQPGRMFLVDTEDGRIVPDDEIKERLAARRPYRTWLNWNVVKLADIPRPAPDEYPEYDFDTLEQRQRAFGYTLEDLRLILPPMGLAGHEPTGSMGNDAPLAVFSDQAPLLYEYFKQLFAQVTNPPLDAIREQIVTSATTSIGPEGDLFEETELHCRHLRVQHIVLSNEDLKKIQNYDDGILRAKTLSILFAADGGDRALEAALETLCDAAVAAVREKYTLLVLSDRGVDARQAPIPALLAAAAVHHRLVREQLRMRCGLIVESGEPREVHHFAMLVAYGVGAINPYVALESLADLHRHGNFGQELSLEQVEENYAKAISKGVTKVISKMGISTIDAYRGAQICEAVGIHADVIERYFTGTPSRIGGIGLAEIERESLLRHARAYEVRPPGQDGLLDPGGRYQWRRNGEYHVNHPLAVATLQEAAQKNSFETFAEFSRITNEQNRQLCTLRGLLEFRLDAEPIPLEEVEPAQSIVKRFKTGAMSFGSISFEAHATLALAMNRIGGKSNSGEGGEDPLRYYPFQTGEARGRELSRKSPWIAERVGNGDSLRSAIKQIASGRFGVTSAYLVNASELQIKMAQGAKPGEGGQLPGHKVNGWIGRTRHSTPGVGLISPPPHHDIYSIEDLAQLIYDLKNANRDARINVKLVSEVGVGTIAAGVAKGKADVVLVSGHDGGTGAAPLTSIKHAGLPWEIGLAETQQVLLRNNLRSRIVVEVDGQLRTGRDVAIACLLGAEEFGFSTAPLIAAGCIMMRKCHLNTCPVGVATQDEELRRKFRGEPEHVINFMFFVAEELRQIMAQLGFRTVDEMVGRTDRLEMVKATDHWKARGVDLTRVLRGPAYEPTAPRRCIHAQEHGLEASLDVTTLLDLAKPALERGESVRAELPIRNVNRTVGTITGSEVTRRYGEQGLPDDTIHFKFNGSAGQSFGAFVPNGMTLEVEGDANDYFGKGLSGGRLTIYPPRSATFKPRDNVIIGNVAFYGATSGEAYVRGRAGERFCVRNSGVRVVVEGVGDHGCEYMTGGRVVVIGTAGRNFAAGMSGGIAYVLDLEGTFGETLCNREMVDLEPLDDPDDIHEVRELLANHARYTQSLTARRALDRWDEYVIRFTKIIPRDYRQALHQRSRRLGALANPARLAELTHG